MVRCDGVVSLQQWPEMMCQPVSQVLREEPNRPKAGPNGWNGTQGKRGAANGRQGGALREAEGCRFRAWTLGPCSTNLALRRRRRTATMPAGGSRQRRGDHGRCIYRDYGAIRPDGWPMCSHELVMPWVSISISRVWRGCCGAERHPTTLPQIPLHSAALPGARAVGAEAVRARSSRIGPHTYGTLRVGGHMVPKNRRVRRRGPDQKSDTMSFQ